MSHSTDNPRRRFTRRRVLQYGAAAGSLSLMPWHVSLAAAAKPAVKASMRERAIPASGEMLPVMGLGTSGAFQTRDGEKLKDLHRVLERFVALGGTLVDTSPTYGNAETNVGRIAKDLGVRDTLFMATKVHINGKQAGIDQMARSTKKLGKPIDLMQIHNFVDLDTQWQTLKRMKADGTLDYIGITHYRTSAFGELEHQMLVKDMDFVQFNYSVLTPDAEDRLLPLAADRGIAVIVNRAFNDGGFFSLVRNQPLPEYAADFDCHSWAQFALKYVLADESVNAVIPATGNPKHLEDNMQAGYGRLPDRAMQKRMRETMASL